MNEVRALAVGGIVSFLAQCFQVKVSFCRSFPSCLAENSSLAPDPKVLTLWRCMIHSWTQGASRCGQHSAPPAHRNVRKQTGGVTPSTEKRRGETRFLGHHCFAVKCFLETWEPRDEEMSQTYQESLANAKGSHQTWSVTQGGGGPATCSAPAARKGEGCSSCCEEEWDITKTRFSIHMNLTKCFGLR